MSELSIRSEISEFIYTFFLRTPKYEDSGLHLAEKVEDKKTARAHRISKKVRKIEDILKKH